MSDFNSQNNRAVWFDIPVLNLDRASEFYSAVLGIKVEKEKYGEMEFGILDHKDGNGGCLIVRPEEITSDKGLLVYMNVNGRIRDAINQANKFLGKVLEDVHSIGPHGFRAIILDSEGNRICLHSETDA